MAVTPLRIDIPHIPPKLLARRTEKPLPGVPVKQTNMDGRIAMDVGSILNVDLLLDGLKVKKMKQSVSSAHDMHELREQNGYLLAKIAL